MSIRWDQTPRRRSPPVGGLERSTGLNTVGARKLRGSSAVRKKLVGRERSGRRYRAGMRVTALSVSESTIQRYTQTDPDVRLMLRVRDGDATAFEEIVARYQDRLLTVMQHLLGSSEMAEDLTQDVFLRVYRARASYVPGAKFATWLFTIANNVASNARRSLARRKEVHLHGVSGQDTTSSGSQLEHLAADASGMMPTRQFDKREMAQVVQQAIESLNERQRMAVLLCKFEDMSYADIAETMGMSPKAVKSLLSRARVNLKAILRPYLTEGVKPPQVEL